MATIDIFKFQGTVQFRRGTSTEWTTLNPILSVGEIGVELDTRKFKIGDDSSPWNSLPYAGNPGNPGAPGVDGTDGIDGTDGEKGDTGPKGERGADASYTAESIEALPASTTIADADLFPILQSGEARKATISQLRQLLQNMPQRWNGSNVFNVNPTDVVKDMTIGYAGNVTIPFTEGGLVRLRTIGNCSFNFAGPFSAQERASVLVEINSAGTGFVYAWPASMRWANGTTISFTPNGTDFVRIETCDGGVTFQAFLVGKDMKASA